MASETRKEQRVRIEAVEDGQWRASVVTPLSEGGHYVAGIGSTIDKALADLAGERINRLAVGGESA